jgi:hypothetical protein
LTGEADPPATDSTTQQEEIEMAAMKDSIPRELAYRASDGIEVWLLWRKSDDRLFVLVVDGKSDDAFEIDVDADHALDAVEHPYAYAASRGIAYRSSRKSTGEVVYA